MGNMGTTVQFSFDPGALSADDVSRLTADMWADLPFDRDILASLKRDGIALDGIHLGGQNPYRFEPASEGGMAVVVGGPQAEILLDLWRIHFLRGLRPRNLAA